MISHIKFQSKLKWFSKTSNLNSNSRNIIINNSILIDKKKNNIIYKKIINNVNINQLSKPLSSLKYSTSTNFNFKKLKKNTFLNNIQNNTYNIKKNFKNHNSIVKSINHTIQKKKFCLVTPEKEKEQWQFHEAPNWMSQDQIFRFLSEDIDPQRIKPFNQSLFRPFFPIKYWIWRSLIKGGVLAEKFISKILLFPFFYNRTPPNFLTHFTRKLNTLVDSITMTCRWNNEEGEALLMNPGLAVPDRRLIDLKYIDIDEGWFRKKHWFNGHYVKVYVNDPSNSKNNPGFGVLKGYNVYVKNENTIERMKFILSKKKMTEREWYFLSHEKLGYIVDWKDPDNTPQHDPWIALGHQKNAYHLRPFSTRYTDLYAERKERDRKMWFNSLVESARKYHKFFPEDKEGIQKCKDYLEYLGLPYTDEEALKYNHHEYLRKTFEKERKKYRQLNEGFIRYQIRLLKEIFDDTYSIVNKEYERQFEKEKMHRKAYEEALEEAKQKLKFKKIQEKRKLEEEAKKLAEKEEEGEEGEKKKEEEGEKEEGEEEKSTKKEESEEDIEKKIKEEEKKQIEEELEQIKKQQELKKGEEKKVEMEKEEEEEELIKKEKEESPEILKGEEHFEEGQKTESSEIENKILTDEELKKGEEEEKVEMEKGQEEKKVIDINTEILETEFQLEAEIRQKEKQLEEIIKHGIIHEYDEDEDFEIKKTEEKKEKKDEETLDDEEPEKLEPFNVSQYDFHFGMSPKDFSSLLFGLKWFNPTDQMKMRYLQKRFQIRKPENVLSAPQLLEILKFFNFSGERALVTFLLFPFLATMEDQLVFVRDFQPLFLSNVIYQKVVEELQLKPLLNIVFPTIIESQTFSKEKEEKVQKETDEKVQKETDEKVQKVKEDYGKTAQEYLEKYESQFPLPPPLPQEFLEPDKKKKRVDVRIPWHVE